MKLLKYQVYHKAYEPKAVHVANVYIKSDVPVHQALEEVFRKTNNLAGTWSGDLTFIQEKEEYDNTDYFENVEVVEPLRVDEDGFKRGHRSTSVGDYVVVDGNDGFKTYNCEDVGWKEVA
jgi:hypothetical protein|tara:strand:- start:599 stop:958 length:360 start_codon:yes stop_codon:yes gene_type:complete